MSPNSAVQKKFAQPSMLLAPCVALTVGLAAAVPQRAARGDVVTDWNEIAINTTAAPNSAVQSRMLAIAHVAMYDAARAVDSRGKSIHTTVHLDFA